MNIIDFCNKHGFLWQPVNLILSPNSQGKMKKNFSYYLNKKGHRIYPSSDDDDAKWKEGQQYIDKTDYIAIKTSNGIGVIDVDLNIDWDVINQLKQTTPYVLSANKKLPHLFVKTDFYKKEDVFDENMVHFGEFLHSSGWSWCKKDEIVYNDSLPIAEFDVKTITKKYYKNLEKIKKQEQREAIKQEKEVIKKEKEQQREAIKKEKEVIKQEKEAIKKEKEEQREAKNKQKEEQRLIKKKIIGSDDIVKSMPELFSLLDPDMSYDDWFKLLCFFHRYSSLEHLKNFTNTWEKYDDSYTEKTWEEIKERNYNGVSLGTIHYMAKTNKPDEYDKIYGKNELLFMAFSAIDRDVADYFYSVYKGKFVYVQNGKAPIWYYFDEHRWKEDSEGSQLMKQMSTDLEKTCIELNIDPKFYSGVLSCLKTYKDQKDYMKECSLLFREPNDWASQLDQNPDLLGFENGVYDLSTGTFRDGKPEDMIKMSTKQIYENKVDLTIRQNINTFLSEITQNKDVAEFLLNVLSYSLGDKYKQMLVMLTGGGGNGKSVLLEFFGNTLGDYAYFAEISLFTSVSKTGTANSDKIKLKGSRACITVEPDETEQMQVGSVKKLTGSDKISARELYKPTETFSPTWQIFLALNNPLNFTSFDDGIARRLKTIRFPFKFVSNPTLPHEKKVNENLKNDFERDEYKQQFMLLLLDTYKQNIMGKKDFPVPKEVNESTNDYLEGQDNVKTFISSSYDSDPDSVILLKTIEDHYFREFTEKRQKGWFASQLKRLNFDVQKSKSRDDTRDKMVVRGLKEKQQFIIED